MVPLVDYNPETELDLRLMATHGHPQMAGFQFSALN
jgi:hypothetical protein